MADRIGKHSKSTKEGGSSMSWTAWAQKYGSKVLNSSDTDDVGSSIKSYFEKKMARADLPMYGVCPAKNQLCLIVCSHCGKSITPQGLLRHYEMRHNYRSSSGTMSDLLASIPSASTPQDKLSVSASERRTSVSSVESVSPIPSPQQPPSLNRIDSPVIMSNDRCARICYILPLERWSGKRKRQDESPAASGKHAKLSAKQKWVDGFGQVEGEVETTGVLSGLSKSKISGSSVTSSKLSKAVVTSPKSASLTVDSVRSVSVSSVGKTINVKSTKTVSNSVVPAVTSNTSTKLTSCIQNEVMSDVSSSPKPSATVLVSKLKADNPVDSSCKSTVVSRVMPSPEWRKSKSEAVAVKTAVLSSKSQPACSKPAVPIPGSQAVESQLVSSPLPSKADVMPLEQSTKPSRRASKSKDRSQRDPNSLPCKDRLFDADRHCGVWIEEIGRQCTHSLTCKIHSLTLRRAVSGRSRLFDQLLSDHRSSKDQQVRRRPVEKTVDKLYQTVDKSNSLKLSALVESEPIDTPPPEYEETSSHLETDVKLTVEEPSLPPSPPSWRSAWRARCILLRSARLFSMLAPSRLAPKKEDNLTKPEKLIIFPTVDKISLPEEMTAASSDDDDEIDMSGVDSQTAIDSGSLAHHPRPLAVNGFGSWSVAGCGVHLFNRREVTCRWAVNAAVDHSLPRSAFTRSASKSLAQESSVISTTMPYCDRYNFVCRTNPFFNHLSDQTMMLSSARSPSLSPPKLQPSSLKTSKLKPSLLSVSHNMRDSSSTCAISPVEASYNTADSLWRSSFVCISSLTSRQEGSNSVLWPLSESGAPSSSCMVFNSPVKSSSFDSSQHLSMLASPPPLKETHSLDQLIESLNSPTSTESSLQSIPAPNSVVNHVSNVLKVVNSSAIEMVVNTTSKTSCSNSYEMNDSRRVPATLNGRVQSLQSLPVRKWIAADGNSSDKTNSVSQPLSDSSSDSSLFTDDKLPLLGKRPVASDEKLPESNVLNKRSNVDLHSRQLLNDAKSSQDRSLPKLLSNDAKTSQNKSLPKLSSVEKSSSNTKVKDTVVPALKSPDRRLSSDDQSYSLIKGKKSHRRRDSVDLCEKSSIDQTNHSLPDQLLQPSSSLPISSQSKSKDIPSKTLEVLKDTTHGSSSSRSSDWVQRNKHGVKSTTSSSSSSSKTNTSEQSSSIGSSFDKLSKKHSSSNRHTSVNISSVPASLNASSSSALLTNGIAKSHTNSMGHSMGHTVSTNNDQRLSAVTTSSKLKMGSNLSTSSASSHKNIPDVRDRSDMASQKHHVTSSDHRSSIDAKLAQTPPKRHKSSSSSSSSKR